MYILECSDESYYTGSTNNLKLRLWQHQIGQGANYTKKRLPVKLVYAEEFDRIDLRILQREANSGMEQEKEGSINYEQDARPTSIVDM